MFASINITAFNTVMVGYNLISDNAKAKQIIKEFCDKNYFLSLLLENVTYSLIFGDSFTELIYNKRGIPSTMKISDPKTMIINTDNYGRILSYQQVLGGKKLDEIDVKYIAHFKTFDRPDSPYGISLIQASRNTIDRKMRTDKAIANALWRHGFRKWIITIGNKDFPQIPPDTVMKNLEKKFEDINERNEFVIPHLISIQPVDERGVQGIEEYYNYFQSQLVTGMLTLEEALGMGRGSTEATATVKSIMYERMIKSFQLKLSETIEKEIFDRILVPLGFKEGTVKIKFNSVTEQDEALKAKWIAQLLSAYKQQSELPFTINEIRSMFGFPPKEYNEENKQDNNGKVDKTSSTS